MYTIKQVAKEAGVSVGTVSNVLNNIPTVTPENRQRVLDAIAKMNYRPNSVARMLKTNRSRSVCLIVPDIVNPFYPELARGAQNQAAEQGYTVFLGNNDRSAQKESAFIDLMLERKVDGMILVKPYLPMSDILALSRKVTLVLVDAFADGGAFSVVNVDDYSGALMAMRMILEQGHRRIGFLRGTMDGRSDQERFRGYCDALDQAGLPVDDALIGTGRYQWHSGFDQAMAMLSLHDRPSALFGSNDTLAIGALRAAHNMGLSVPGDLSVVGYDDIDIAELVIPALTTIHRPKYELGVSSMKTLLRSIDHGETAGSRVMLQPEPRPRETLGAVNK